MGEEGEVQPVPCLRSNSLAEPLGGAEEARGTLGPHTRFALGCAACPAWHSRVQRMLLKYTECHFNGLLGVFVAKQS